MYAIRSYYAAGIHTFSGLAALSAKEIADLVPSKTAQQITKQGWITQARKLTRDKAKSKAHKKKNTAPQKRSCEKIKEIKMVS